MTSSADSISQKRFYETAPAAVQALLDLGKAVDASGLDKGLSELIKLRVSQINGCAFCTKMHLDVGRKLGVDAVKLELVAVWPEVDLFTPREKAALAWAEACTRLPPTHATDEAYAAMRREFSESEAIFLTAAIANINAWNRIAAPLHYAPQI
ncbi:MAG TPA: carboxymuconolactone decarboxylase family protein [Candidatus Sulfotelmatobacter sp.]|nr:carboxymuconolactone decarboxylase family protein [Candidatus Sulfotelmatobacter sp.]